MILKYLLDTNALSEPLRPSPDPNVLRLLQQHRDECATAATVWHELWFGCHRLPPSKKRTAIEVYLYEVVAAAIPVLSYDGRAAQWHAAERARLTKIGKTPPFADGQIAAIAVVNNLTLVTANIADFANFQDLRIRNWSVD
jgi:tRNA(fMet)-specific endonuclease VapC